MVFLLAAKFANPLNHLLDVGSAGPIFARIHWRHPMVGRDTVSWCALALMDEAFKMLEVSRVPEARTPDTQLILIHIETISNGFSKRLDGGLWICTFCYLH